MRNLTIKREKSFVGFISKMKIYIEDPTAGEITINHTPCRKIGELKNGEEKTFLIEEQAAKVFVIADRLSKSFCNEYYQIPEGQEDLFLSGKNKFNPARGNAFRFHNNDSAEVLQNRKRGTRKGLIILTAAAVVGAVCGFVIGSGLFPAPMPQEKVFSSNGMYITLTDEFKEVTIENYTATYDSSHMAVFALKEAFAVAEGFENYTLEEYADLVIQANQLSSVSVKNVDGLVWFEYEFTNPTTNATYRYVSYVYKTDDAFWTVQFVTLAQEAEIYAEQIAKWAKKIEFSKTKTLF